MKTPSQKGFTIVELLIVIIVIGILATLVLLAYNSVQNKAADAKRQADANSLRDAAANFKGQSTTGYYPGIITGTGANSFGADLTNANSTYPSAPIVLDPTLYNLVNSAACNGAAPVAVNKNSCYQVLYCGSTQTAAGATGIKFVYWSDSLTPAGQASTYTGSGC